MPIHELLSLYGYGGGSTADEDEEEEEEDDDEEEEEEDLDNDESSRSTGELKRNEVCWCLLSFLTVMWRPETYYTIVSSALVTFYHLCAHLQGEGMKNSSGQGDEVQATSEGRTRPVRSLGTAELIRPQKLLYFESMYHLYLLSFWCHCLCCCIV